MNKQKILDYLFSLKASDYGFYLQTGFNQKTLMSSSFVIIAFELLNEINLLEVEKESIPFLEAQDERTGLIVDPLWKEDFSNALDIEQNYIIYQTTAFALSVLDVFDLQPQYRFKFLDYYRNKKNLRNWFYSLDWANPWHESNKIMFLLQFFSFEHIRQNNEESKFLVLLLLDLLDENHDTNTGYWGTNKGASNFNAMAGAFHFYNHYKYYNRVIPSSEKALCNTLNIQEKDGLFHTLGGGGACEDLDAIDIIYKLSNYNEKSKISLTDAYHAIIVNQIYDGGFCWAARPKLSISYGLKYLNPFLDSFHFGMFKWIIKRNIIGSILPFYKDNQIYQYSGWDNMKFDISKSDGWSTWFRLLSLATIQEILPELKSDTINFKFRSIPSLGWQYVR